MSIAKAVKYMEHEISTNREKFPVCKALMEHRCSCGRLLGRFNGQAEVKCPKCGKMNVIGVENHGD